MEVFDFSKSLKHLYTAKQPVQEVDVDAGTFLAVEGQGAPGGEAFQKAVEGLYGVAYTVKFTLKLAGVLDFKVCNLEGLYLSEPCKTPRDEWRWRLQIRVPDAVTAEHLKQARKTLIERKGLDTTAVKRIQVKAGRALQMLHVGPYDQVGPAYAQLDAYARENGLRTQGPAHEIYISDPRRAAPEKLKTIVRLPVKKA